MKEKCGIFGVYNTDVSEATIPFVIDSLKLLQHRGQEGCGIAFDNNKSINYHKGLGLVKDVFNENITIPTNICIGHVRYSTSGSSKNNDISKMKECQPLYGNTKCDEFYLAHNGNIPKIRSHDTQYLVEFIENSNEENFENKLISLINTIPCAYSLIILFNNTIYTLRDCYGIRPLCIGNKENSYCVSSETHALQDYNLVRDVNPGEIIKINNEGLKTVYQSQNTQLKICAFEYLYFLNPNSICDGYCVNNVRKKLGRTLANKEDINLDDEFIVIGIPESGLICAKNYAKMLSIEYKQAITKTTYVNRTFIIPNNNDRINACKKKFLYDQKEIENKKIIIIDDTIVRGNVMKSIINSLLHFKAKEIHIRIGAPPIINTCQLGIDIPSHEELLAYNKTITEIKQELNVNSIMFLTVEEIDSIIPPSSYKECFGEEIDNKMIEW